MTRTRRGDVFAIHLFHLLGRDIVDVQTLTTTRRGDSICEFCFVSLRRQGSKVPTTTARRGDDSVFYIFVGRNIVNAPTQMTTRGGDSICE